MCAVHNINCCIDGIRSLSSTQRCARAYRMCVRLALIEEYIYKLIYGTNIYKVKVSVSNTFLCVMRHFRSHYATGAHNVAGLCFVCLFLVCCFNFAKYKDFVNMLFFVWAAACTRCCTVHRTDKLITLSDDVFFFSLLISCHSNLRLIFCWVTGATYEATILPDHWRNVWSKF